MFCFLNSSEYPCKTPAFVRQKRNFFPSDPQASPSVLKNIPARQVVLPASVEQPLPLLNTAFFCIKFALNNTLKWFQADIMFSYWCNKNMLSFISDF